MVEITAAKRRRVEASQSRSKFASDSSAHYPLGCLFSSLTYKQAPECLSSDAQGAFVITSPQPNPASIDAITGDVFLTESTKTTMYKTPMRLAEQYHQKNTITHVKWHQNGTFLATADEIGKIAVWNLEGSVDRWSLTYEVDLHQPLAALLWLRSERSYVGSKELQRDRVLGPRNPYGQLGFVAVTVHGEVSVHYQRNGGIFSNFSTMLPKSGKREIGRPDMGCFGMVLSGLDGWQRISHASIIFDKDGALCLATYYSSVQPKYIQLYKINIKFPVKSVQEAITCQTITKLRLTSPLLENLASELSDPDYGVTQILLSHKNNSLQLAIGLGRKTDKFDGYFGRWQLRRAGQTHNINPGTISHGDRQELSFMNGFSIKDRFITSIASTHSGAIALGLSDGSTHMEYRTKGDFGLLKATPDTRETNVSLGPGFWQVTEPHAARETCPDTIATIAFSPHETHMMYLFSSGKLGVARITEEYTNPESMKNAVFVIEQMLKLSLLNNTDKLDLTSELVRLGKIPEHKDTPERVMLETLVSYENYCNQGDLSVFSFERRKDIMEIPFRRSEEWCHTQMGHGFGLAMSTFRIMPEKRVQYKNLCKAMQLPVILECFIASCTSERSVISDVLEKHSLDTRINLTFSPEALWSLVPLATWTLDYMRWLIQQWCVLFNTKRPRTSPLADISGRPVHAVLLIHKPSRTALCSILTLIHHFIHFITSSSYELPHILESRFLLQRYASNLLQHAPVSIKDVLLFLKAFDRVDKSDTEPVSRSWNILLSSHIPRSQKVELERITQEHKATCAQPAIYMETHADYPMDVIRKQRIDYSVPVRACVK
ncbi:hypothetical protein CLU79DRAFT_778630 [Phycomyces nitens]|nr:hypothetical protein CLU79DRAFT_778630 [Phycomyces nitens]